MICLYENKYMLMITKEITLNQRLIDIDVSKNRSANGHEQWANDFIFQEACMMVASVYWCLPNLTNYPFIVNCTLQ